MFDFTCADGKEGLIIKVLFGKQLTTLQEAEVFRGFIDRVLDHVERRVSSHRSRNVAVVDLSHLAISWIDPRVTKHVTDTVVGKLARLNNCFTTCVYLVPNLICWWASEGLRAFVQFMSKGKGSIALKGFKLSQASEFHQYVKELEKTS